MHEPGLAQGQAVARVDAGGFEQFVDQRPASQLRRTCVQAEAATFEQRVARQGEPVGVQSRRTQAQQDVAGLDPVRPEHLLALDHANGGPADVVVVGVHDPGVLRGLATDQRTAGLDATLGDPGHDGGDLLRHDAPGGDVVGQEQRFGPDHDQVVDDHRHHVDTDGVVAIGCAGDGDLGADAVGGRGQHRVAVPAGVELEQPGEPAEAADNLGSGGPLDRSLHQLDRVFAGGDVDAGRGVGGHERLTRMMGAPRRVMGA